jgi:hypothetical protein
MCGGTQEGLTVTSDVEIRKFINFETATDGTAVRLVAEDVAGRTVGIILTIDTLSALLMTLPRMVSDAIKRAWRSNYAHHVSGDGLSDRT